MDIVGTQRLWFFSLCGFWFIYANIYFSLLTAGVLGNTKQQKNCSNSINMKNYHNIFHPFCSVWIPLCHRSFDIFFLGEYWLRYAYYYFTLLKFGVLVVTKQQENGYSSISMSNHHNIFTHFGINVSQILYFFFLGEYCFRYDNIFFTLIRFGVLMIIKQQENSSRSINMKNCHNCFSLVCRVCISLYHTVFDVFSWVNVGGYMPIYILHYSDLMSW